MANVRRFLIAVLVVACGIGCGARGVVSASPTDSPDSPTASTSSASTTSTSPTTAGVPPISDQARAAGFIDVRTVVPSAIIDLRYATPNNFVGAPMYPPNARCLVHDSMGPGLAAAAEALRAQEEVLVFWDCYRPHEVQVRMFEAFPAPGWVATPGPYARSHETGRSVDVTLASRQAQCVPAQRVGGLCLIDMGTDFDEFSPRANAFATEGVSPEAQTNRARLRSAMSAGGLKVYSGEWWHFDTPDAYVQRPILDVSVN